MSQGQGDMQHKKSGEGKQSEVDKEILRAVEQSATAETAIQEEFGDLVGQPDRGQKETLQILHGLFLSLGGNGPEKLLTTLGYSRAAPYWRPREGR